MHYYSGKKMKTVMYHILVSFFGLVMVYPLIWMMLSSFKESSDIFFTAYNPIPKNWKMENYINGWKGFGGISFASFFKNSTVISVLATIGAVFSSAIVAFGFARCSFKLKGFWFSCMMLSMMMPGQVLMVPQFLLYHRLNWVGTYLPLIIPSYFGQGFFIFLIIQFIQGIPADLDEAARIDGCSYYMIFGRIVLPLIVPAMVTSTVFSFMWTWENFMGALLYLNKPAQYPVSLALKLFSDPSAQSDWGATFAMASLSLIPIFAIFIFFQKYLVEGITTEGLKG